MDEDIKIPESPIGTGPILESLKDDPAFSEGAIPVSETVAGSSETPIEPKTPTPTAPTDVQAIADLSKSIVDTTTTQAKDFGALDSGRTGQAGEITDRLLDINEGLLGQSEFESQQREALGVLDLRQQQASISSRIQGLALESQDLTNQMNLVEAKIMEQSMGRGRTNSDAKPLMSAERRTLALRQADVASRALTAQAELYAVSGDLASAEAAVEEAVNKKFGPLIEEKTMLMENLDIIKSSPGFTEEEKARADQRQLAIQFELQAMQQQMAEEETIKKIGIQAQQSGAPTDVVQRALRAPTIEDAMLELGVYAQDPELKLALESLRLGNEFKKLQIAEQYAKIDLLNKYGGLSPSEWAKQKEAEEKEIEELTGKVDAAKREIRTIDEQTAKIGLILDSNALDTVVGPTMLTRGAGRQKEGFFGKTLKTIAVITPIPGTGQAGLIDEISGGADDVVAFTEQIISQQFLDKLVETKGKGATFGQLSDREGNSLRSAANSIGAAKIEKDGRVIGYDMSEKNFRREMGIILDALALSREDYEDDLLQGGDPTFDLIESAFSTGFNPAF